MFLLNKSPNFHDFFGLLFETVLYSKQSSTEEFTVYKGSSLSLGCPVYAERPKVLSPLVYKSYDFVK